MLEEVNPSIIVAQTKTPGAVMLHSTLDGYRTFYGNAETTISESTGKTEAHVPVVEAYLYTYGRFAHYERGYVYSPNADLRPTIPDVRGYPEPIREAFVPVIRAQARPSRTKMAPLLSIQKTIFQP